MADARGETARFATGARDDPEVAGVFENDLRFADGWIAQKEMAGRLGMSRREEKRTRGEEGE